MNVSYHNDPELKAKAVAAAKKHRDADMLVAGTYGRVNGGFKGCSVGCDAFDITGEVHPNPHHVTAQYFGFPEWFEHLRDVVFEGLPESDRRDFHVRIKESAPVGVDLEPVKHQLAIRRMNRLIDLHADNKKLTTALERVRDCHQSALNNEPDIDWKGAESAARLAARSAGCWSAESAARSAGWSAESAAWSAGWSAGWSAESAAWLAGWSAAWQQEANDLLRSSEGIMSNSRWVPRD